ncbi:hypothetical protein GCM10022252_41300 [Streptosporangium oxazolinicum]|uniref:Uncharacterized protein n=1 Tax=Streptosporangium oxazolinicum TaxID=909287 RepID=A0ABP8B1I5_9ACTN
MVKGPASARLAQESSDNGSLMGRPRPTFMGFNLRKGMRKKTAAPPPPRAVIGRGALPILRRLSGELDPWSATILPTTGHKAPVGYATAGGCSATPSGWLIGKIF